MGNDWLMDVLKIVVATATPLLVGLAIAIARKMLKRLGLELEAEQQAQMEKVVRDAILRAEELAAARIKANEPPAPKLHVAVNDVLAHFPEMTHQDVADLIHAHLPRLGLGAASLSRVSHG